MSVVSCLSNKYFSHLLCGGAEAGGGAVLRRRKGPGGGGGLPREGGRGPQGDDEEGPARAGAEGHLVRHLKGAKRAGGGIHINQR